MVSDMHWLSMAKCRMTNSIVNARLLGLATALMVVREGLAADKRPADHVALQNLAPLCREGTAKM